jgi:hypothetical protein
MNTNCGACGHVCQAEMGMSCQAGKCVFTTCFEAGTRVAMADGTSRPIELVCPGDRVLVRAGRVHTVVALDRTQLGDRLLDALNDGSFFVTAEHPFWTTSGWKAIDPAATALENPTLPVGKVAVGDRLLALAAVAVPVGAGNMEIRETTMDLEIRPLHRITGRPGDPATPLYSLMLDGDHTYFADDLLVHNKE